MGRVRVMPHWLYIIMLGFAGIGVMHVLNLFGMPWFIWAPACFGAGWFVASNSEDY